MCLRRLTATALPIGPANRKMLYENDAETRLSYRTHVSIRCIWAIYAFYAPWYEICAACGLTKYGIVIKNPETHKQGWGTWIRTAGSLQHILHSSELPLLLELLAWILGPPEIRIQGIDESDLHLKDIHSIPENFNARLKGATICYTTTITQSCTTYIPEQITSGFNLHRCERKSWCTSNISKEAMILTEPQTPQKAGLFEYPSSGLAILRALLKKFKHQSSLSKHMRTMMGVFFTACHAYSSQSLIWHKKHAIQIALHMVEEDKCFILAWKRGTV